MNQNQKMTTWVSDSLTELSEFTNLFIKWFFNIGNELSHG